MARKQRNEISYYPEIMDFISAQIKSNFMASQHRQLKVYWGMGELSAGLRKIVAAHPEACKCVASFAFSVPPLNLDIFAVITDGTRFQLLILEVKLVASAGLSEWSQLVGYCIVSGAKYGLLINIDAGGSTRLHGLLQNEKHISYIQTLKPGKEAEHILGFMQWDSLTQNFEYTNLGEIWSLSALSERLAFDFRGGSSD